MTFIAAAIIGGTALVGGVIASSATSKAANKAAQVSQDATASNNALSREIYGQNTATLAPFVAQGGAATSYINQLLGIQTPAAPQATAGTAYAGTIPASGGYGTTTATYGAPSGAAGPIGREDIADRGYGLSNVFGGLIGNSLQQMGRGPSDAAPAESTVQTQAPALAPGSAANAFDAYRGSTGYQFRLGEGMRAVTANKALSGLLNSGSAVKSAMRYGDGLAASEFDNYFNRLAGQQGVGLSAASAQAGVANNYSSQVQNNNSTNASNIGNAAIAKANGTNNFINGLVNAGAYAYGARG